MRDDQISFERAKVLAEHIASQMKCEIAAITYYPINKTFTASFLDKLGYSYVYLAETPLLVMIEDYKSNWTESKPEDGN